MKKQIIISITLFIVGLTMITVAKFLPQALTAVSLQSVGAKVFTAICLIIVFIILRITVSTK